MIYWPGKKISISRLADSGPSEAWTRFICWLALKSPRMVPGLAFSPLVTPAMSRTHPDHLRPFDDHGHHRPAGDKGLQLGIPRLVNVFGIVSPGQFGRDPHQLHGGDVQPLIFEPGDYPAHQAALDAIGLEQNEGAFHG